MTHLSNNIQELHDKMQPSLSHTVDRESRLNGSESDCTFLDRALKRLTTEENKTFQSFVSNNTMGSALKKHKKDGKNLSNHNDNAAIDSYAASKKYNATGDHLPVLIVSDTSTASESCINCESSSVKSDNEFVKEDISEHTIVVKQESSSSQSPESTDKLDAEEVNGQLKRDSAYGSSPESSNHILPVDEDSDLTCAKETNSMSTNNCLTVKAARPILTPADTSFPSVLLANKWSSNSSLASDSAVDGSSSPQDCEHSDCTTSFLPGKDFLTKRNLSFSSLR